jgi:hypothetical protein
MIPIEKRYKYCLNEGCSNETVTPRLGKSGSAKGYYIHYRYCSVCNNLRTNYGITKPEKDKMVAKQKGKCLICDNILEESKITTKGESNKRIAVVDHCHETNKVRGILCSKCNRGLGLFEDSVDNLTRAIKYLKENQ